MSELSELLAVVPREGRIEWIGVAASRRAPIRSVREVLVERPTGLAGDHHATSGTSKRQVTLIQAEHFPVIAALLGREAIDPALLRRNVVVAGVNLLSLKHARFRLGDALLEGTGPCAPCSLMETNLGPGGYSAMRGHGGITAVVLEPGTVRVGDPVRFVELASIEEKPV